MKINWLNITTATLISLTLACGGSVGQDETSASSLAGSGFSGNGMIPTLEVETKGQGGDFGGVGGHVLFAIVDRDFWLGQHSTISANMSCDGGALTVLPQVAFTENERVCFESGGIESCLELVVDSIQQTWNNLVPGVRERSLSALSAGCIPDAMSEEITSPCAVCGILPAMSGVFAGQEYSVWCESAPDNFCRSQDTR